MKEMFEEKGQGMVEYALILVFVAVVVIVALAVVGPAIGNVYSEIQTELVVVAAGGPSVRVSDIAMSVETASVFWLQFGRANAEIVIVDQSNQPMEDATVEGEWSGLVSGSDSVTTDASGTARFSSPWTLTHGTFVFTVQDVTAEDYPFKGEATSNSISW